MVLQKSLKKALVEGIFCKQIIKSSSRTAPDQLHIKLPRKALAVSRLQNKGQSLV